METNNINTPISKISKVEIKGLWDRFDLEWDLQPDVNILSGINGSGKSTILDAIVMAVNGDLTVKIGEMKVFFNSKKDLLLHLVRGTIKTLLEENIHHDSIKTIISEHKKVNGENLSDNTILTIIHRPDNNITQEELDSLPINLISTFDQRILESGNRPDENVRTELDRDIFRLQKQYLDYQLNIGKRVIEAVKRLNGNSQEEVLRIERNLEHFKDIIDTLFKDTSKRINRDNNEISFWVGEKELSAYNLSSGEKQILVILLTVLVQDNKSSILFMDEPEISLHFDWQKKLIQYIRELNPNCQIILATHSPAIIMEGWSDKVVNVQDLIVRDTLNPTPEYAS